MGTKDDIYIWRALNNGILIFLRHTSADCNLEFRIYLFARGEKGEISVELVICIFADSAGIKDDEVGIASFESLHITGIEK